MINDVKSEKRSVRERVTLKVAGVELNLVTEESSEYMEKLASEIDERVSKMIISNARINKIDAALFCALDYLDAYHKLREDLAAQKERTERITREFALLKEENDELKTLLGGSSASASCGVNSDDIGSEKE